MIGNLGRRATELVVFFFALLGFAFVPLGQRTALEHLGKILATAAASEAGHGLVDAFGRLRTRLHSAPNAPSQAAVVPLTQATRAPDAGMPDASLQ